MEQNKCGTQNFWLILKFTRTMGATEVYIYNCSGEVPIVWNFLDKMDTGQDEQRSKLVFLSTFILNAMVLW